MKFLCQTIFYIYISKIDYFDTNQAGHAALKQCKARLICAKLARKYGKINRSNVRTRRAGKYLAVKNRVDYVERDTYEGMWWLWVDSNHRPHHYE